MPVEVAMVRQMVLSLESSDEFLVEGFVIGSTHAVIDVQAEQDDTTVTLLSEERFINGGRLESHQP